MWIWLLAAAFAWEEQGGDGRLTGRSFAASDHFAAGALPSSGLSLVTDPQALGAVAGAAAEVLRGTARRDLRSPGLFAELGVGFVDVLETLDLVARVAQEDTHAEVQRLQDAGWIREHFDVYDWTPDHAAAKRRGVTVGAKEIRLTKYVVYQVNGSAVRTSVFNTALYGVPFDEQEGPARDRMKYTRMDVYRGVYEEHGEAYLHAKPLVYLTREGSNQALMQGTIEVAMPGGEVRLFNVHRNNGIGWRSSIKDPNLQPRYWYFHEVEGILGFEEVPLQPGASVAGDLRNLGPGKLIALRSDGPQGEELRLAILADTGGAFQPNLFQLDFLAGSYPSPAAYKEATKHLPLRAAASVLVRKAR